MARYNFHIGYIDLKQGRIDSAKVRLAEINSLLPDINPADKDEITFLYDLLTGEVLIAEGSLNKAVSVLKEASPMDLPNMSSSGMIVYNIPSIKDGIARAYYQNNGIDKAIIEYERLINFDPASKDRALINPKYHYRLAKPYEERGLLNKAVEQYEMFLQLWKDADEGLRELIDAKAQLEKLKVPRISEVHGI